MLRNALHRQVPEADVDDVLQAVDLEIWRRQAPLEVEQGDTPQRARRRLVWGILRRQVLHHRKESARCPGEPMDPADLEGVASVGSAEDRLLVRGNLTAVEAALRELSAEVAACVRGYYFDGATVARIAAVLRLPANTVYNSLQRGRSQVREIVSRWDLLERSAAQLAHVRWMAGGGGACEVKEIPHVR